MRSSSLIRNYLGFPKGVSGSRLAEQAYEQALVFGATFLFMHRVTSITRQRDLLRLSLEGERQVTARTVILTIGATYRRLGIDSLENLSGAGVFYGGPVSEAPALSGKVAYVVGGGYSAGQAVLHLALYAKRVTLVVRAQSLEMGANILVRTRTEVVGGNGEGRLQQLVLCTRGSGQKQTVAADALFVLIGADPAKSGCRPRSREARAAFSLQVKRCPATPIGWRSGCRTHLKGACRASSPLAT